MSSICLDIKNKIRIHGKDLQKIALLIIRFNAERKVVFIIIISFGKTFQRNCFRIYEDFVLLLMRNFNNSKIKNKRKKFTAYIYLFRILFFILSFLSIFINVTENDKIFFFPFKIAVYLKINRENNYQL